MDELNTAIWTYVFLPCFAFVGALLTLRCRALQFRRFGLALRSTVGSAARSRGGKGGVSPFEAASTALAATVGTGNIVGTAQAIAMGGRGAVFWLWAAAFVGMAIKYTEIYLGILFRVKSGGEYTGGPMQYIERGLGARLAPLAGAYALLAALSALCMGNMSQINGSVSSVLCALREFMPVSAGEEQALRFALGGVLAAAVFAIMAGGAARAGRLAARLVPFMGLLFILLTSAVAVCHAARLPETLCGIVREALSAKAALGGAGGFALKEAVHWGLRRSAFSNEAGLGTAAVIHASSSADSPEEQGLWGIFEVFADTIVGCTATALAILCSGVSIPWGFTPGPELLQAAFSTVFGHRASALFICASMSLFGFSTVIGCSVCGAGCVRYLSGEPGVRVYRFVFSICTLIGSVMSTSFVWSAADTVNVLMALPNFVALTALSGRAGRDARRFFFDARRAHHNP